MQDKLVGDGKERYINRLFGSIAPNYDLLNSVISFGLHKRWRRTAVRISGLSTGGIALDVATGTGDFAIDLAKTAGPDGCVIGADFCRPMLKVAAQKTSRASCIKLVVANAEHLPFDSNTFDCATIGFALRNVSNVKATIAEMVRVIKPGGRVISLEIVGPASSLLKPIWHIYFSRLMPELARLFGAEREPYDYLPESVARFYTREELAEIFRDCGMADIKIRDLTFGAVCIHIGTKI